MTTRRRFIEILPLAGLGLGLSSLAACGDKAADTVPAPAAAPMPAPAPVATPEPTPAPAAEPAPASAETVSLPLVSEQDPVALTLGYVALASTTDKAKFPQYAEGQNCGNCALYGAPANSEQGPCPLFPARHVLAAGWCASYVRKG